MSRVAKRPLNSAAVHAADDQFYANHPEMIDSNGRRIPLSPSDPTQAALRSEWMDLYIANGGELEGEEEDNEETPPAPVEDCPSGDEEEEPTSTITARWSKAMVRPDQNSSTPPATPPTDTVPANAKVEMLVDTTNVPDGKGAQIEIYRCVDGASVPGAVFNNLEVRGNKVVDPATGAPPVYVFAAPQKPWDVWDAPYFYFKTVVDHEGLTYETPKDFRGNATACLRVDYWHVCLAESSTLSGVLPECNTVNGILAGVSGSQCSVVNYATMNTALNVYGSHIRNTYVFHQASHGNVRNRNTGASIGTVTSSQPPDDVPDPANWRSVVSFTPNPRFGDAEINTVASIPSTPRYLWYSSTCLTGWESSFADAMIARGTRNVLAFRRTIPDAEAPQLAQKFYNKWAGTYNLDPSKIPDCFFEFASDHYDNMRPVLFGAGGGQATGSGLSGGEIALIAVGAVVGGLLVGAAIYTLLN